MMVSLAIVKPYFGLRGTALNIMISIIAGLDFLYVHRAFYLHIQIMLMLTHFWFLDSSVMTSMLTRIIPNSNHCFVMNSNNKIGVLWAVY